MKKLWQVALVVLGVLVLLGVGAWFYLFTPEEMIKPDMIKSEAANFVYYYEPQDQANMEQIANRLDQNHTRIVQALGWTPSVKTTVVIYPTKKDFQHAGRGRFVDYIDAGWYCGDNRLNAVLITSPSQGDRYNDANSIIQAAVHEYVHMVEDNINKDLPLWWHEGIAMYIAGQKQNARITDARSALPDANKVFKTGLNTLTSLEFGNNNGYQLSYILIEYVAKEYGVEKLAAIVRDPNHPEQVLGTDYQTLHAGWLSYIDKNYR